MKDNGRYIVMSYFIMDEPEFTYKRKGILEKIMLFLLKIELLCIKALDKLERW